MSTSGQSTSFPPVRDARADDLPAIQAIYAHHVIHGRGTFEETPPDLAEIRRRHAAVIELGFPWLVAEVDGVVAGYAYAGQFRARTAYRFTVEDSIYIAHDRARQGVGHALLSALIARCESGPWRQMLAVIGDSANLGSIALHRKLGFRPVGTFDAAGYKFGAWVDVVLMQRELGDGARHLPT